jgi:hypothetical protein
VVISKNDKEQRESIITYKSMSLVLIGVRGGAVVEAQSYKPERRGIDSRWCLWNFSLT